MPTLLAVFIGGALGTTLRYLSMLLFTETSFPIATFTVNMLGTLGLIIFYTLAMKTFRFKDEIKGFIATGLFGALTTFSALALEVSIYITNEEYLYAFLYLTLSYTCGLIIAILGYRFTLLLSENMVKQ
jgi:fluoride exporter